jgi:hypothetical protein
MRIRSWTALVLASILFSLGARVWADPPRPQALWRVYLPVIMRGSPLAAVTPGASPSATASETPQATLTASPSASVTATPTATSATATPTRTAPATLTRTPTATATVTPTTGPSPTASPTAPCVAIPTLLAPANAAGLNTLAPLLRFDSGSAPSATRYELQVSRLISFSLPWFVKRAHLEPGVSDVQLYINLEPATHYFWRVRLQCGEELAPWSEVWSFDTASSGSFALTPTQLSPADGVRLTAWPVTLTWMAVPGVIEYYAFWRKPNDMATNGTWTSSTQTLGWGLESGTLYEWAVGTRNTYGIGPNSTWRRFTTPSTPPAPEHVVPSGGRFTVNDDGSVVWQAD